MAASAKALKIALEIFEKSAKIPKYSNLLEFFVDGFQLTDDDRFKNFDLRYSPWVSFLCELFESSEIEWINLIFGSQLSKTTFMMGVLLYVSQYVRGATPCLWVQSTEEEAGLFVSERLRPFLDESSKDAINKKTWKKQAFRVNNSAVKVGFATTKNALRSKPARYIFGDECGIWKETISYVKKRTRTFAGRRKGIFATTPPDDPNHHSIPEIYAGNFYQWWVPCPSCGEYQGKTFANLKFDAAKKNGIWNHSEIHRCARYKCKHCGDLWSDAQKLEIMQKGKAVCVDNKTYEAVDPIPSATATLQINALYSVFTSYGTLASEFITAKQSGVEALKVFFTDELAEVPDNEFTDSLKENDLGKYVDNVRVASKAEGYQLYTCGVDVQRSGKLYYVVMGWKSGALLSGHVIEYGTLDWFKDGKTDWQNLTRAMSAYQRLLYCVAIDSTDGVVSQEIFDFCSWAGNPYTPLKDTGANQLVKVQRKHISEFKNNKHYSGQQVLVINSTHVKDDIASAMKRPPNELGSWSFPKDTTDEFFKHLSNEKRITVRSRGKLVTKWVAKYHGAPQHWWSAMVYATAAMEEQRKFLQVTMAQASTPIQTFSRYRSKGVNIWQ